MLGNVGGGPPVVGGSAHCPAINLSGLRYNPASTHAMRKAALLYNPDSGGSQQRQRELESALAVLRAGGVQADLIATQSPDHAGDEARLAIDAGCDTIFACGGDVT